MASRPLEYALSEEKEPAAPPSASATITTAAPSSYPAGLSTREAEVLKLVARGLINAQVAQEPFISVSVARLPFSANHGYDSA